MPKGTFHGVARLLLSVGKYHSARRQDSQESAQAQIFVEVFKIIRTPYASGGPTLSTIIAMNDYGC